MDLNPENVKVEDNEIWIYGHDFSRNTFWRQNKFTVKAQQHYKKFHNLSRNSDDVVCHLSTHESCCNTKPEDIAKFIIDRNLHGKDINLYFVTDGEIDKAAINKCKSLNLRINYKKLILVSINENLKNDSIAFAFFNPGCHITIIHELADETRVTELQTCSYELKEITTTNFSENYEDLLNYVITKFTINIEMLVVEKTTKKLLVKEFLEFEENLKKKKIELISELQNQKNLEKSLMEEFRQTKKEITDILKNMKFYKDLIGEKVTSVEEIAERLDILITYLNNAQRDSFSISEIKKNLQTDKFKDKPEDSPKEILIGECEEIYEQVNFKNLLSFCDKNSHLICFSKNNFIIELKQRNNQLFTHMLDYPLILIDNQNFLKEHTFICQTYDVRELLQTSVNGAHLTFPIKDHLTRTKLIGCIVPYEFADSWNDYSISCAFLQGRKVKKSFYDIFYYVLFKKLQKVRSVNRSVVQKLKMYALDRIKKGKCRLTFSSLTTEPQEVVPIPIALFYSAQLSSELFGEDYSLFKNEKLRSFCNTSQHIVDILKHLKMDIDRSFIEMRSEGFVLLNNTMEFSHLQKLTHIISLIFRVQDGFILNEIVNPGNAHLLKYLYEDMHQVINFNNELSLEDIQNELLIFYSEKRSINCQISERTCRPKYLVDGLPFYGKTLKNLLQYTIDGNNISESPVTPSGSKNDIDFSRYLSLCKIYTQFVRTYRKYPSMDDYKKYLLKQKGVFRPNNYTRKLCIFPSNIFQRVQEAYNLFAPIRMKMSVNRFINLSIMSFSVDTKIYMENSVSEMIY